MLVLLLAAGLCKNQDMPMCIQAARTQDISKECQMIYFEDGSSLTVTSDDETMVITGTHVKSTSRISYATVGYHMTLEPTGGYVDGKEHVKIKMIDKTEVITDEVTTSYILDRQSIVEGAYQLFRKKNPDLKEEEASMQFAKEVGTNGGVDFFLHNIFAVIERTGGSGSTVLSTSKAYNNLGTRVGASQRVSGILNAVEELYGSDWSEGTKKKLPEYYDIHLKMYVNPCNTSIVIATEDGNVIKTLEQEIAVYQYANIRHQIPEEIAVEEVEAGEKTYRLTQASVRKSYVTYGDSPRPVQTYSLADKNGLKIQLAGRKIQFQQMYALDSKLYLIVEEVEKEDPKKDDEKIEENEQTYAVHFMKPENTLSVRAGEKNNSYFEVETEGIPVNESLFLEGELERYLFEAEFSVKTGEITFYVPVRRTYLLRWKEPSGEEETEDAYIDFEVEQEVVRNVPITRSYGYVQIESFACYGLFELTVQNGAFAGGEVTCTLGEGILAEVVWPEISYTHYDGQEVHIKYPEQVESGVNLSVRTVDGGLQMPDIPQEDFAALADGMISGVTVRNDAFAFDGRCYLTDEEKEFVRGMEIVPGEVFSGLGQENVKVQGNSEQYLIPEQVQNEFYESFGTCRYREIASFGAAGGDLAAFEIAEVNGVYVYTPVYCDAVWQADNKKYSQLVNPQAQAVQLVLDAEGNTSRFSIGISNTGYHSSRKGYGNRNYASALGDASLSYIAKNDEGILRNEVRFPFDVFEDTGELDNRSDDRYIPAGTWLAIGRRTAHFYLPEWVREGIYTVEARSIAANCTDDTKEGEADANRNPGNYIASDTVTMQVSGRICDFFVYDIADYPAWEEVFRERESGTIKNEYEGRSDGTKTAIFNQTALYRYFSGAADACGRKRNIRTQYTVPVLTGDHPVNEKAQMKFGYTVRFCVTTIGERMSRKDSYVDLVLRFFVVDKNGSNRKEVDLYYTKRERDGKKYLVKIGSKEEIEDGKKQKAESIWLGIPPQEREAAEKVWGEMDSFDVETKVYNYSHLRGEAAFRTAKNFSYYNAITGHAQYFLIRQNGITERKLLSLEQGNYFEYSLPYDVMAVEKDYPVAEYGDVYGIDFTEAFWERDGFLIVSFDITAMASGTAYLSYRNDRNSAAGYCNMWELEEMKKEKRDKNGVNFRFYPGDVFVFPLQKSIRNDYLPGGIY